jgi:hypothetical protein
MKLTLGKIVELYPYLNTVNGMGLPPVTAYRLKRVRAEFKVQVDQFSEIRDEIGSRHGDPKPGGGFALRPGKDTTEADKEITELWTMEVDVSDPELIPVQVFIERGHDLSGDLMDALGGWLIDLSSLDAPPGLPKSGGEEMK